MPCCPSDPVWTTSVQTLVFSFNVRMNILYQNNYNSPCICVSILMYALFMSLLIFGHLSFFYNFRFQMPHPCGATVRTTTLLVLFLWLWSTKKFGNVCQKICVWFCENLISPKVNLERTSSANEILSLLSFEVYIDHSAPINIICDLKVAKNDSKSFDCTFWEFFFSERHSLFQLKTSRNLDLTI